MKELKYYVFCFIVGGIMGYFLIPRVPDIKTVTEIRIVTKTEVKDKLVYKDRIIERKIIEKADGTKEIVEKEVIKDRIVEKKVVEVKEVEKIVEKEIYFTGGLAVGFNIGDIRDAAVSPQFSVYKNIYLQNFTHYNINKNELGSYILIGLKF